ncbi:MAG: cryptochrome/photolyase family protein [Janthinobacterium lividum]
MTATLLWLRQDLRLQDNQALQQACLRNLPIIPLYILDTTTSKPWAMGGAQQWWLHHSLISLGKSFEEKGLKLILRRGNPLEILKDVLKETQASALYWNRCYQPYTIERDRALKTHFKQVGIEVESFNSFLLFEPWTILTYKKEPIRVYRYFWKACLKNKTPDPPVEVPNTLLPFAGNVASDQLQDWNLLPKISWDVGFGQEWQPGEQGAQSRLSEFVETNALVNYRQDRSRPDYHGSSKLSPHLHFGEIGPRQIWSRIHQLGESSSGAKKYLREIGWREFCAYLLYHFPTFPDQPFQSKFTKIKWQHSQESLTCWQKGCTGYPIVDAGMRQLWYTGWMHNRVRMIMASFLCKHLLVDWTYGEKWFWDTLVDADLASNAINWQWVVGSGISASSYVRIFNPILQGEKFDPEGNYVRTWVPELKNLPKSYIHQPWAATEDILQKAGIVLGQDYPRPIVEHTKARRTALEFYGDKKKIKDNTHDAT